MTNTFFITVGLFWIAAGAGRAVADSLAIATYRAAAANTICNTRIHISVTTGDPIQEGFIQVLQGYFPDAELL